MLSRKIVSKPWGFEYLVYESPEMALWLLHIKGGHSTSLHCHPTKTTGFLLLSGRASLEFIADSKVIEAPNKEMIRRGLFHRTRALSEEGIWVLEAENPNDKEDLVRLDDAYGRGALGYESGDSLRERGAGELWIETATTGPTLFEHEHFTFLVERPASLQYFSDLPEDDLLMFLSGGLSKTVNGRTHLATVAGDIGQAGIVASVARQMECVDPETFVLRVAG